MMASTGWGLTIFIFQIKPKHSINNKMDTTMLEKIVHNTEPKNAFYLLLSERSTQIATHFKQTLQLDGKWEMALVGLETYYSFPNIDITKNNLRYSRDDGVTWHDINVPEGCYEISDINNYVQKILKERGASENSISIEPNNNTLKCVLNVAAGYKVDFTTSNSLRTVLGFSAKIYAEGYNESENIVNIMSVSSLRVTNDLISGSYNNGVRGNIIYSFFPNAAPGYKIIELPVNPIYLPITLNTISRMETKLVDQDGKLINLRGEELSIRFHVRQI